MGYGDALRAVERIAGKTVFAPESGSAPVQVMGPLEAAGSEFDAVWLLRAGEMSWPPEVRALPLVRWGLQRELRMPGTDAAQDLKAARRMTERIAASGGEVVVSYAVNSGEVRQGVSAVVRGLGLEEVAMEAVAGREAEREVVALEEVEDLGRVRGLPDTVVSGGVRVLELQAACGFRAFAEQRLGSKELESLGLGLSAMENGTAVHKALECFWNEVGTQARLIAMTERERTAAVGRAIDTGLRRAEELREGVWDEAYLDAQRERLRRVMEQWLEMERRRPAFAVRGSEQGLRDVEVGPLRLKLRVDRVDVVDEKLVLIDYKTGLAGPADWLGERPDAPQVPLYAVLAARTEESRDGKSADAVLGAVAFGSVRAGKRLGLRGLAEREELLPGRAAKMEAASFAEQVSRWGEVLERLAGEFAAGGAEVRPKNYPKTVRTVRAEDPVPAGRFPARRDGRGYESVERWLS